MTAVTDAKNRRNGASAGMRSGERKIGTDKTRRAAPRFQRPQPSAGNEAAPAAKAVRTASKRLASMISEPGWSTLADRRRAAAVPSPGESSGACAVIQPAASSSGLQFSTTKAVYYPQQLRAKRDCAGTMAKAKSWAAPVVAMEKPIHGKAFPAGTDQPDA